MLDFYLIGIARSGTTVMTDVLNCNKKLYRSKERFGIDRDPVTIDFPETYLNDNIDPERKWFIQNSKKEIQGKTIDQIICYGDKQPQKIYNLKDLSKVRHVLIIYRRAKEVIPSWNTRAAASDDERWPDSNIGLFFFIDFYLYILGISSLKNLCITNYEELFYGDYQKELKNVFSCLCIEHREFDCKQFLRKYYNRMSIKRKKRFLSEAEKHLLQLMDVERFENELFSYSNLKKRKDVIRSYATKLKANSKIILETIIGNIEEVRDKDCSERIKVIGRRINQSFRYQDYKAVFSNIIDWYQEDNDFVRILKNGFTIEKRKNS